MQKLYTVEQAAEHLSVQPNTVRVWLRERKIKGVKLGGGKAWRIAEEELKRFIEEEGQDE